ncbi:MAG TPA: lytic transglycosylase domain-containing protein [Bryobacterales bacterium]|nr:lytic transglycosylase domain-containing protein [Bryobacterales bacterium]
MKHPSFVRPVLLAVALAVTLVGAAQAGEFAVLTTGFRIQAERHEINGDRVRLYTSGGGTMDIPSNAIARFEPDGRVPEPPPAPLPPAIEPEAGKTLDEIVAQFASEFGLPEALVHSVIAAESAYDPNAVSPKGAVGLMQLMPGTAQDLAVSDRTDPGQNVRGGTTYLRQLLERYRESPDSLLLALAAYNAGPGRVDQYRGLPPFNETRLFVRRVLDKFLALTAPGS